MALRTKALRDLLKFQRTHQVNGVAIAEALSVSKATVSCWLSGRLQPDYKNRLAIEIWTGGAVRSADWLTERDHADLARVRPHVAPQPAEVAA